MLTKPLVMLRAFGWLAALTQMLAVVSLAHAADPNDPYPPVVALGNDTYVITRGATFFYFRNTSKLVTRARDDAKNFCHDLGKEMKELSVEEIKAGLVIGDFAKARITFKALAPGDPALAETKPRSVTLAPPAVTLTVAASPAVASDLTQLEELRRSGVLTEAEFSAAKKRLVERSLEELHAKGVLSDQEFAAARKRLDEH